MIHNTQIQQELVNAEHSIEASGTRATSLRKRLLGLLLCSSRPLSAYELTNLFNQIYNENLIANSVYRILKDLMLVRLAHRLNTINKYVACQNANCRGEEAFPLFTICHKCLHVEEESASIALVEAITENQDKSVFNQIIPQIELSGLCACCNHPLNHSRNQNVY